MVRYDMFCHKLLFSKGKNRNIMILKCWPVHMSECRTLRLKRVNKTGKNGHNHHVFLTSEHRNVVGINDVLFCCFYFHNINYEQF